MRRLPGMLHGLRRRASVRAVGVMALSSALGQLAVFATLPILTRLYDPVAFGRHALFMAFVGVASVGVCLCLDHRIVSTVDDEDADNIFAAAVMSVGVTLPLSCLALALLIGSGAFGYAALPFWAVAVMAAMIGLNGISAACRSRVIRQQDYALVARTGLLQNVGRALAPLALFPLAPFWLGVTGGEVAARTLGVRSLTKRVWHRRLDTAAWRQPKIWWSVVRKEYRFTAVLMGTVLVDALASQMISPLLATHYGAHAAGEYFLAAMIIVGPSSLIGAAAADVIHARGADVFRQTPAALPTFMRDAATALLALALVIFIPVYLLAPLVLPLMFGAQWPDVSEVVRNLIPFAVVGFVASPCARLLASINRPTIKVVSDIFRLAGVPLTVHFSAAAGQTFVEAVRNLSWFLVVAYSLYFCLTYFKVSAVVRRPG